MDDKEQNIKKLATFQRELESSLKGKQLQLKINDNRSTMLSVRWTPKKTWVSMHHMFLDAPENIMNDLACYIRKEHQTIHPNVRKYIDENVKRFDYSHTVKRSKLEIQGRVYNLKEIYDRLNSEYFNEELDLYITWFGRRNRKSRSQVTFGLYHDNMKLIKINRMLDNERFPEFMVSYVVYHEMLHNVCPAYYDANGRHRIHSREFKQREKEFAYFKEAQDWIKKHRDKLFFTLG